MEIVDGFLELTSACKRVDWNRLACYNMLRLQVRAVCSIMEVSSRKSLYYC